MARRLSPEALAASRELHEKDGFPYSEIARKLHCSERTIARHLGPREKAPPPAPAAGVETPAPSTPATSAPPAELDRFAPVLAHRIREGAKLEDLLRDVPLTVVENLLPRLEKMKAVCDAGIIERIARLEERLNKLSNEFSSSPSLVWLESIPCGKCGSEGLECVLCCKNCGETCGWDPNVEAGKE